MASSYDVTVYLPSLNELSAPALKELNTLIRNRGLGPDWDEPPVHIETMFEVSKGEPITVVTHNGSYQDSSDFIACAKKHKFRIAILEEATSGEALYESDQSTELYWYTPAGGKKSAPAGRMTANICVPIEDALTLSKQEIRKRYLPPEFVSEKCAQLHKS